MKLNQFFLLLNVYYLHLIFSQIVTNYTFDASNFVQYYIVPANAPSGSILFVQGYGAQGGKNGGLGGCLLVKTNVNPGQIFTIDIGESSSVTNSGAHGGGGQGKNDGGSGGGATFIYSTNFSLIVGGGGGGFGGGGGVGGGEIGGSGGVCEPSSNPIGATGGSQITVGKGAYCNQYVNNDGFGNSGGSGVISPPN